MSKVSNDLGFLLRKNWINPDMRGRFLHVLTHRWYSDGLREGGAVDFDDDATGYIDILREELRGLHEAGYIGEALLRVATSIITDPGIKIMSFHDDLVNLMETKLKKDGH